MKTAKRAVLLVLCAMLLVIASVLGTMAYLTDTDSVTNTFTVGNVQILLNETDVDEDGDAIPNASRVLTNEYKLVAGHEYTKDPMVTVLAKSEESYVRMIVKITDLADAKEVFGTVNVNGNDYLLPQYFVEGWDPALWVTTNIIKEENNTAIYEFRYYDTVTTENSDTGLALDPLFDSFTIPTNVEYDDLAKVQDMQILVEAHAIQADGFDSADDAWAAFDAQHPAA